MDLFNPTHPFGFVNNNSTLLIFVSPIYTLCLAILGILFAFLVIIHVVKTKNRPQNDRTKKETCFIHTHTQTHQANGKRMTSGDGEFMFDCVKDNVHCHLDY